MSPSRIRSGPTLRSAIAAVTNTPKDRAFGVRLQDISAADLKGLHRCCEFVRGTSNRKAALNALDIAGGLLFPKFVSVAPQSLRTSETGTSRADQVPGRKPSKII